MREGLEVTQLVNAVLKLNYGWRKVGRRFGTNRTYIDSRPSMVRIMRYRLLSKSRRQRTFRSTSNAINRKQLSNQTASRKTPISGIKKSKMLIAMAKM